HAARRRSDVGSTTPAVDRGRGSRLLRDLSRIRSRCRAAARTKRSPLQHGIRDRDALPARGRNFDWRDPPLALAPDAAPRGGLCRRVRWRLFSVEGVHLALRRHGGERALTAAAILLATASCPVRLEAHLNSTGLGPFYDGALHLLQSPEDLIPAF